MILYKPIVASVVVSLMIAGLVRYAVRRGLIQP